MNDPEPTPDFRDLARQVTDAIKDLEFRLVDESCLEPASIHANDLCLSWSKVNGRWRISCAYQGREDVLLQLPVSTRVKAYRHLNELSQACREAQAKVYREAGLL